VYIDFKLTLYLTRLLEAYYGVIGNVSSSVYWNDSSKHKFISKSLGIWSKVGVFRQPFRHKLMSMMVQLHIQYDLRFYLVLELKYV